MYLFESRMRISDLESKPNTGCATNKLLRLVLLTINALVVG